MSRPKKYGFPESGRWVQFNVDSGCAQTCSPEHWIPGGVEDGYHMRTASGEYVPTKGWGKLVANDEQGRKRVVKGRRMKMHKCLVSAACSAAAGWDTWLTTGGGWMYRHDSPVGRKIEALLIEESQRAGRSMTPLWEEYGVYNFYLHMGPGSCMEPLEANPLEEKPKETEKEKESRWEPTVSPFGRQPKA